VVRDEDEEVEADNGDDYDAFGGSVCNDSQELGRTYNQPSVRMIISAIFCLIAI
jgi:hypothetical protein